MATINMVLGTIADTHPSAHAHVHQRGFTPIVINFAEVAAAKGSPLVAGDVIRTEYIPQRSAVSLGTLGVRQVANAEATAVTLSVGTEASTPTRFVNAFNYRAASVGALVGGSGGADPLIVGNTTDYITLTITALTGTLTSGIVSVGAELLDLSARGINAGLATRT